MARLEKGDILPDFNLPNVIGGGDVSLSKFIGKSNIIIYFWTPAYAPNVEDVKLLQKYQKTYADLKVFCIINIPEDAKEVQRIAKENSLTLTNLIDRTGEVSLLYETEDTYPVLYFADKKGRIGFQQLGGSLSADKLDNLFREGAANRPEVQDTKMLGKILDVVDNKVFFQKSTKLPIEANDILMAYTDRTVRNNEGKVLEYTVNPVGILEVERIQDQQLGTCRIVRTFGVVSKNVKITFPAARWNLEGNKLGNDSDLEAEMYKIASQIEPKVAVSYLNLGILYLNRKDFKRSLNYLSEVTALDPTNPRAFFNLGLIDYAQKKYQSAVDNLKLAIKYNAKYTDAYYNLGCIFYNNTKNIDKALEYFLKVAELEPTHPLVYTNLGLCLEQNGEYKQAIQNYKQAIATAPDEKWTGVAKQHLATMLKLFAAEKETQKEGVQ
ncbi:MAG: tetratricopeptide repeat protein [Candidatus Margulisiibacteriota bacterium]